MIRFGPPWFGRRKATTDALSFARSGVSVAADPAPPPVLAALCDTLCEKNADALVRRFVLDPPSRLVTEADFRAFFEHREVRADLIGTTEYLSGEQSSHLIGKPVLFGGAQFGFEPCSKSDLSRELLRCLDTGYGPGLPDKGAALVGDFAERCLPSDASVFRSTRHWAFWLMGEAHVSFAIMDHRSASVTFVLVSGYESFVRPVPYGGTSLARFETRWPAGGDADDAVALELEPLAGGTPATDAFARSFRLSAPNSRVFAMRLRTPLACGAPSDVARRFEGTDVLARILDAPTVRDRLRCAPAAAPGAILRFHRLEAESRMASFARMLETGGTFGERRLEPPADVARLVAGLAGELCGAAPAKALVYESHDRWSAWFVGLMRATTVAVDPETGRIAILMICEWD